MNASMNEPQSLPVAVTATHASPKWWFWELPFVVLLLLTDRISKSWALNSLPTGVTRPFLPGFLSLHLTTNTGAAFSIFTDQRLFLSIVSSIVLCIMVIGRSWLTSDNILLRSAWSFIFGGALGNLWDRLLSGFVVDFFVFDFVVFPVFNVADIAISCGGVLYLGFVLFSEYTLRRVNNGER